MDLGFFGVFDRHIGGLVATGRRGERGEQGRGGKRNISYGPLDVFFSSMALPKRGGASSGGEGGKVAFASHNFPSIHLLATANGRQFEREGGERKGEVAQRGSDVILVFSFVAID